MDCRNKKTHRIPMSFDVEMLLYSINFVLSLTGLLIATYVLFLH